jgi:rod shape-determining protein MreD
MGYFLALPILAVCVILQNSWLTDFRLLDGQPELVLMAVLAWAWHAEQNEAVFWAFVGGIFQDVLNPIVPTGTTVIAMLVMVFVIKAVERNFYQVSIFTLIGFVAVGALLGHIILLIVLSAQGLNLPLADYFLNYSVPCIAFNLIGTFPSYFVLRRIQNRLPRRQSAWEVNVSR